MSGTRHSSDIRHPEILISDSARRQHAPKEDALKQAGLEGLGRKDYLQARWDDKRWDIQALELALLPFGLLMSKIKAYTAAPVEELWLSPCESNQL